MDFLGLLTASVSKYIYFSRLKKTTNKKTPPPKEIWVAVRFIKLSVGLSVAGVVHIIKSSFRHIFNGNCWKLSLKELVFSKPVLSRM